MGYYGHSWGVKKWHEAGLLHLTRHIVLLAEVEELHNSLIRYGMQELCPYWYDSRPWEFVQRHAIRSTYIRRQQSDASRKIRGSRCQCGVQAARSTFQAARWRSGNATGLPTSQEHCEYIHGLAGPMGRVLTTELAAQAALVKLVQSQAGADRSALRFAARREELVSHLCDL